MINRQTLVRSTRVAVLLAILQVPLSAQEVGQSDTSFVDRLIGAWHGEGKLFGADAVFSMTWERVLGGQFIRLTFENKLQRPNEAARVLQAQAFYKSAGVDRLEGTWFDSRGMVLPLEGSVAPASLTTLWGTPATEQGRTVYRVVDEERVEVEDYVLKEGQWHEFGRATYRRVPNEP